MKQDLLTYLNERRLVNGADGSVTSSDNLLLSGLVDSIGLVQMIAFIEERSGLVIPNEDVTIENFGSVDDIIDYLTRLRENPEPSHQK